MEKEIWKQIDGYCNYEVSNTGKVRSVNYRNTGRIKELKPRLQNGYYTVALYKNGKSHNYSIHRLVAEAFIPNTDNLPFINHKSEIKTENNVENLEWCDGFYNQNYGTCPQRKSTSQLNRKDISKQIAQYDMYDNFLRLWPSGKEVQRQLGFHQVNIAACCRGLIKKAYGYKWRYV